MRAAPLATRARVRHLRDVHRPGRRLTRTLRFLAITLAAICAPAACHAGDPWEAWPELNAFVRTSAVTRLHFSMAYAQGKESPDRVTDLAGYLDLSIKPVGRKRLQSQGWERNRYLWARAGYDHVLKGQGRGPSPAEDRAILALYAKDPLPWEIWLEGRARTDLRWISGTYSTRYRFRAEVNREWTIAGHPVAPYVHVEWFYDTRYDGWSRTLYELGPEVTVDKGFRIEVYLARQVDRLPGDSALNALGAVAKWYF